MPDVPAKAEDALASEVNHPKDNANVAEADAPVRTVNLILDHSAFVLGLGNVKRWFHTDYVRNHLEGRVHLNLYIPSFTLHELGMVKRGSTVRALSARESLAFIEHLCEEEAGAEGDFGEEPQDAPKEEQASPLTSSIFLEFRTANFPSWGACQKYRALYPTERDLERLGPALNFDQLDDERAVMPVRLRHLVRSCVYMKHARPSDQPLMPGPLWKLVTEDMATKVWAQSFGMDCLNVNEAELLLFHARDVTAFEVRAPGADFGAEHDMYNAPNAPNLLHRRVDTSKYGYSSAKGEAVAPRVVNGVITEAFDTVSYAPRESGALWNPGGKSVRSQKGKSTKKNSKTGAKKTGKKTGGATKTEGAKKSEAPKKNEAAKKTEEAKKSEQIEHT